MEQPLERLRDDQEEKLVHNLISMFRECEKYSDISRMNACGNDGEECFAVDMVATKGKNLSRVTFRLPESEIEKADELEKLVENVLAKSDNENVAICTLLRMLNKKMAK